MRLSSWFAAAVVLAAAVIGPTERAADAGPLDSAPATAAPADAAATPSALVRSTPKGQLHNPYRDTQADIVGQGEILFRTYTCSGCHGALGGGGMCPSVINDTWVYGGDDDTLFRLVALGSAELQALGYTRIGRESIVSPMPPMGGIVKTADDLWKMLAFIRAHYGGDPVHKYGTAATPP